MTTFKTDIEQILHVNRDSFFGAEVEVCKNIGEPAPSFSDGFNTLGVWDVGKRTIHINLHRFQYIPTNTLDEKEDKMIKQIALTIEHEVLHEILYQATGSVFQHHAILNSGLGHENTIKDKIGFGRWFINEHYEN